MTFRTMIILKRASQMHRVARENKIVEKQVPLRMAFIINPVAGGGRAIRGWKSIVSSFGGDIDADEFISRAPGDAKDLARIAAGHGYDSVIAVGGDGTLHEVVNGLMAGGWRDGVYSGPRLGLLPLGRGNDFARTFRISGKLSDIWGQQAGQNLPTAGRLIDVGRLRTATGEVSHFVNMCGAGFDADVAATANRMPRAFGGAVPYLAGILVHFLTLRARPLRVLLRDVQPVEESRPAVWDTIREEPSSNGRVDLLIEDKMLLALSGIGRFLGGGMKLLPHADPVDGFLDVMLARPTGRLRFVRVLQRSFSGEHLSEERVAYFRARRMEITADGATNVHADGDFVGRGSVEIEVLPRVLPTLF